MQEYVRGRIFDAANSERKITFRGTLLRITSPNTTEESEPLLDVRDVIENAVYPVPAGFQVKVLDGWVKLTKSAEA